MATSDHRKDTPWLLAAALMLAMAIFAYPLLLGIPLIDPDEGLHASIAQEMVERGDWVTPRFLGQPFLDKPVLYTWTQAVSLQCLGMCEAAVRLPGLMFGLLAMLTTGLLAWRMFGRTVGLVAGILYATMVMPTALAQVAAHDVALVPWVNMSLLLFWEADRAGTRRGSLALAALVGVFLGLACLTKGLVGVGLVGTAYGLYLLVTRRLSRAACLRGLVALAVAALAASFWYAAMERRNPGYLHYYFIDRHVLGFATETQKHGRAPFWYYVPILLGGGLPWIFYLPVAVRDWLAGRRDDTEPSQGGRALLWCWLIGCTVLLSAANSKLVTYIWPVFPPIAILAASVWGRKLEGRLSGPGETWFARCLAPSLILAPLLTPIGMGLAQAALGMRFGAVPWALGVIAALTAWTTLPFWHRGNYRGVLVSGTLSMALQFVVGMAIVAPPFAAVHTARDLAGYFNRLGRVPSQVLIVEDRVGSVVFYLDPRIRASLQPGQLEYAALLELKWAGPRSTDGVTALAERNARNAERNDILRAMTWQRWGRYRLYRPVGAGALSAIVAGKTKSTCR